MSKSQSGRVRPLRHTAALFADSAASTSRTYPGSSPRNVPPITPRAGAMMARGALPNLPNWPLSRAACKH